MDSELLFGYAWILIASATTKDGQNFDVIILDDGKKIYFDKIPLYDYNYVHSYIDTKL